MKPLIDGDILRYEIGFAAQTGWKAMTESDDIPPFDFVMNILHQRIDDICSTVKGDSPRIYLTEGKTFRYDVAKRKPYKGNRKDNKPWHYQNLTSYIPSEYETEIITYIEADDAMAIEHSKGEETVICSRDKDLRQVPGMFYSWELGRQPSFGPELIDQEGSLSITKNKNGLKLMGTGLSFFYAQVLMGDPTDNIPGLPGCGPGAAFHMLYGLSPQKQLDAVCIAFKTAYKDTWEEELTEQGILCWMCREMDGGKPKIWEIGMVG